MLSMIFERRPDGSPAPRMPRTGDGTPRTPDGVRFFDLGQAVQQFNLSEEELRSLYDDVFGDLFAPDAPPDPSAPLPARQVEPGRVVAARRDLVRAIKFAHLSDAEFDAVADIAALRGLDLWRHVFAEVSTDQRNRRELRVITSIHALLLIAERTGQYDGTTTPDFLDADGNWHPQVWPARLGNPIAARIGVRRKGFSHPQVEIATWDRYVAYVSTPRGLEVSEAWIKGGPQQLAKCALAMGLRHTFPEELGGIYTTDEMAQSRNPPAGVPAAAAVMPLAAARHAAAQAIADRTPDPEEVVFDHSTPDTPAEFELALEGMGFTTPEQRAAVVSRLRMSINFPPTSRSFWAAALARLRTRPDLYGAIAAA